MGVKKLEDDFYVLGIVIEVRFCQVCLRDVYIQLIYWYMIWIDVCVFQCWKGVLDLVDKFSGYYMWVYIDLYILFILYRNGEKEWVNELLEGFKEYVM